MSIWDKFEGIFVTILPRISILPLYSDGRQCMALFHCRVVESSCLPTHNIVPHISWHDLPCHKIMKKYKDFPSMVMFQLLLRKFWIRTWLYICQQYPCSFHTVFEYTTVVRDLGKMLVLPNQLLYWILSTSDQCFVSSQPIWRHSHTQIRITFFSLCTNKQSHLETFFQLYFNWIFSKCLSHDSPAKRWPYRFRSRGMTGFSILDHDLGHLCRGIRIQCLDISIREFSIILGASSISTWV